MSDPITTEVIAKAAAIGDRIVEWRRHLHRNPELSFGESKTSAFVAERLSALGLPVSTGIAKTGVVSLVRGKAPGKTVLLRADMDALPIQEETGLDYASRVPGVMHACGHDAHTAMLLGAAEVLTSLRDRFAGTVKLMFQPAEELGGGGRVMVEEGVLEDPHVDAAFALHVNPMETGVVNVAYGYSSAASDRFVLTVRGASVHSTMPHKGVDAILIAAQIVVALNTVVGRSVDPMEPSNLSVGTIRGGTAPNIVADSVEIVGSIRSFSAENRNRLIERIRSISVGVAGAMGGSCSVDVIEGYPALFNDTETTDLFRSVAAEVLAATRDAFPLSVDPATPIEDRVRVASKPMMGSEDFAFVLRNVPGTMFNLGTRGSQPHGDALPHNSRFTVDDSVLPLGTMLLSSTALRFLART